MEYEDDELMRGAALNEFSHNEVHATAKMEREARSSLGSAMAIFQAIRDSLPPIWWVGWQPRDEVNFGDGSGPIIGRFRNPDDIV